MLIDTQIKLKALNFYYPDGGYVIRNGVVEWIDNSINNIAEEEIQAKIAELEAAEPLRLLRIKRNELLQETDWTQNRDVTLSNDSDWQTYRQSLRDLPSTASPQLDEKGQLINVTWPTKPA